MSVGPNYLVMEFVDGIPVQGPLPLGKALESARQILDALEAAHSKGIIHRDLKPTNILLTKQGIKLLDFGLAKRLTSFEESDAVPTDLTRAGQIVGTLAYMSPEQLRGKGVDARSDLFSFGCVLYEMLSGRHAFTGESTPSLMAMILEREPTPLDVAPPLDRVIRTCLAKYPDQRFQTAVDLKRSLEWALEQPALAGPSRRSWTAAAAALVLGALGDRAMSRFHGALPEEPVLSLQIEPTGGSQFVFGTGTSGFALSPEGRAAVYVGTASGKAALWIRPLADSTARLLAGTEGAGFPFWSPNSRSIAFFGQGKLQRIDLGDGSQQTICEVGDTRGGAWGDNGQILFGVWSSGIFQVAASGGTPTPLTTLNTARGEIFHYWPQILPGGRVLYFVRSNKPEYSGAYVASLAKPGEQMQLLTTDTNALYAPGLDEKGYLLWLRGSTLVAQEFEIAQLRLSGDPHPIADPVARIAPSGHMQASLSATGNLLYSASNPLDQLTWRDREGKPHEVLGDPGLSAFLRLSPDGRRVVMARANSSSGTDLWVLEVERGVASRFTSRPGTNSYPVWSPDGRTILFASGPPFRMFRKETSGAGPEQPLTASPNPQFPMDWSRDGRFFLYEEEAADGSQRSLWMLPTAPSDARPKLYLQTTFNQDMGRFSPDTRWVAFQCDESGRYEIYVDAFPEPRGKVRISTGGGMFPEWSTGGRELFYVSADSKLMSVSLSWGSGSVEPAAPRELFPVPVFDTDVSPYVAAADGQRFLVLETQERGAPTLTLLVNWQAMLKKRANQQ